MLRFTLRLGLPPAVVLGSALVAGLMLQHDWLRRRPDAAPGVRYGIVAPLVAVAIGVLWLGYLRLLRAALPASGLESAVRRDAWTLLPLLLTLRGLWAPLSPGTLALAVVGIVAAKLVLCPRETGRLAVWLLHRAVRDPARGAIDRLVGLRPRNALDAGLLAAAGGLLAYTVARAARLSFTGDESISYLHGVRPGPGASLLFGFVDANNHLLNTVLMSVTSGVFGAGELSLRLPNLLAHAAYLLATYAIARRCGSRIVAVAGFVLLNANPFLLDFFSLARGYGLGLAFLALSLAEATAAWRNPSGGGRRRRALWLAVPAVLSNLSFLNYYLALLATFWLQHLHRTGRLVPGRAARRAVLDQVVLLVLTAGFMIHQLWRGGKLYYGGTQGLWADTASSLIRGTLYGLEPPAWTGGAIALGLLLLALGAVQGRRDGLVAGSLLLVTLALASLWLQHQLLGVRYLQGRTALLFLPLVATLALAVLDRAARQALLAPAGRLLAAGAAGALLLVAGRTANLTHTFDWPQDADTRQLVADLGDLHEATGGERLEATWFLVPAIDYYRVTRGLRWMELVEGAAGTAPPDWLYLASGDPDPAPVDPGRLLRRYDVSGNVLIATDPAEGALPSPVAVW